jgi:hypothetical protein
MAENKPLLDRSLLDNNFSSGADPISVPPLPNLPFRSPNFPLPKIDGQPSQMSIDALLNKVLSLPSTKGSKSIGSGISRTLSEATSDRFDAYLPGYNNEDAYAQGQHWTDKMINGVGKGLLLTGTTLLQTTVGSVNGLFQMAADGRGASFYDNNLNRWIDEGTKKAENILPNYYTDVEKNAAWYSGNYLFSGNFLWDGIVKNLGFAAGAAASGYLFSVGLRALPLTARLFSVGKAAETLAATEEGLLSANKAIETYGKVRGLSDKFLGSYSVLNPLGTR